MDVRWIEPGAGIGAQRDEVAVCVDLGSRSQELLASLTGVLAHTPDHVPILVCARADERSSLARELEGSPIARQILLAGDVNTALCAAAPADVVVLRDGCVVAAEWLERLRAAAHVDSGVATATAIATTGGPALNGGGFERAAAAVAAASLRIRPRLPEPAGSCTYLRRSALELVEVPFTASEFARSCVDSGLLHVVADDVLVLSERAGGPRLEHPLGESGPLARSIGAARRAVHGLSVIVDARNLGGPMNGTRVHVLELIAALARSGRVRLTALVPPDLSDGARRVLESLPEITLTAATSDSRVFASVPADIVHRPFQVSTPADLTVLGQLGDRIVVTHQDLIAYNNPSYFRSFDRWQGYRSVTRTALAIADRVLFFSAHARDDALAEDLIEPDRATVVHIGVDHVIAESSSEPVAPAGAGALDQDVSNMLCLGTDYRHKNRMFALRLLEELMTRHGWEGRLILAGPHAGAGSSAPEEERFLAARPQIAAGVVRLGEVSEAEKAWLLGHTDLVLYPTVREGFGLVPFEAADHGVPCAWAGGTALSELLPASAASIVPWDVTSSAERTLELLRDERARADNVEALRRAAAGLTWKSTAERLVTAYQATCDAPPSPASVRERGEGLMRGGLGEDAIRLVGPGGALPRELERPLLALATHPWLGKPVFSAIKAGYRAWNRWPRGAANGSRSRTRVADR